MQQPKKQLDYAKINNNFEVIGKKMTRIFFVWNNYL